MKTRLIYLFAAFILASTPSFSQKVSGQWYGVGNVERDGNYSQYLSELILTQKGNAVSGEFNYYFKSTYIPARVSGTYNSKTRLLELHIIPVLNFKALNVNGADCPMKGLFILKVSQVETTLNGQFETTDHYKYTCPNIIVRFKKELISPEEKKQSAVRKNIEEAIGEEINDTGDNAGDAQSAVAQASKVKETLKEKKTSLNELKPDKVSSSINAPVNKPVVKKIESIETRIVSAPGVNTDPVKKINPAELILAEVAKKTDTPPASVRLKPAIDPTEAITKALKKRSFEESPVIEVEADSIELTLYDNGEVDGDTIALFHNRVLLARDQRLSDKPIKLTIQIDTTVHEISMYAENLGTISPNTALCVVMVGEKRFELNLTSNFIKNGTMRFRKKTQAQLKAEKEYLR